MTPEQIVRKRLVELVDALLARYEGNLLPDSLHTTAGDDVQVHTWAGHDVPAMSTTDVKSMNELIDALQRVDEGKYGRCDSCGEPVGFQWLLEHPTTRLCESCSRDEGWRPSGSPR